MLPREKSYERANELAYQLARERLAGIEDIERQCLNSGTQLKTAGTQKYISLKYLNRPYLISLPGGEIAEAGGDKPVPMRDRLIIIHYFLTAKGTPLAGKPITFRELPEGSGYYQTFARRTIRPLTERFGKEPRLLLDAGHSLGARKADYGDTAITVDAFPRVPITIVLWTGDEEFPPQGNVLLDASISDYLPTEDITVLCEIITWRLVRGIASP